MTLWGGRFDEPPDDVLWAYTASDADRRLLPDDVRGSIAHVRMLGRVGILDEAETAALVEGLSRIAEEAEAGTFVFAPTDEDVHTAVERRLGELVGSVAAKLHTGRSRNDQVALDLRLYLDRQATGRIAQIERLVAALAAQAEAAGETVVPSYTHLQQAQPVPLAHHLLAHAWALLRDRERFVDARERIRVSPLGAGAGGGSSLPLDPAAVAEDLGWERTFENSMDAVADRDVAAEYAFVCAQTMVHLSRLAEELVLWATTEFGWATYPDRLTTGSSALPHKKNPDIAELARGKAARTIGDVVTLLTLLKGLPLTYNRDLQEDKEAVFDADDTLAATLEAVTALVAGAVFHPPPPDPSVTALDLAEALVSRGVGFRDAHEAVGRLIRLLEGSGRTLAEVTAEDLAAVDPRFAAEDVELVDPVASVRRRRSPGGGSFASVADQLGAIRRTLGAAR